MGIFQTLLLSGLLLLNQTAGADAGVQVQATVDRNEVSVGDVVHLTVTVSAKDNVNFDEPHLPNIPGFDLINVSSSIQTRSAFENGRFISEQSRSFIFMLAASQKGKLRIPEITVNVDGKPYRTQSIVVAVNAAGSGQNQAQNRGRGQAGPPSPFDQMDEMEDLFQQMLQRQLGQRGQGGLGEQDVANPNDAFFIQAEVDKSKVFVGEQVRASFYLVTRGQIRDIDTLNYPELKGFWKEDLEMATRLNFEPVVVNGVQYQRALLVSYALFPIKPGKSVIDSYRAKCTVVTGGAFGMGRSQMVTKMSKPLDIEVMELPANRPANYTGAVGSYRLSAHFEPSTGSVGQPVTLRVRIEGQGNAKLIELPKLELPTSFELYDQKSQAKYMRDGNSFKEFEVLMIPRQPGVFKIAPVSLAVFDPRKKQFSEISSQPLDLSVTGQAGPAAPAQAQTSPGDKGPSAGPVAAQEPQLPPLATEMQSSSKSSLALVVLTSLAYLSSFGFLGFYGWQRLRRRPKKVNLGLLLQRRLQKVRELMAQNDWRRVGVEMTNTAYAILGQLSEQGGANQEIGRLLEHTPPSLRNELSEPIRKLISQCEALSFAPESMISDMTEKKKMDQLIANFEKVLRRAIELAEI